MLMTCYRLATSNAWIKLHPKTGALGSRPTDPGKATCFDSEEDASQALAKAVSIATQKFASYFEDGVIPAEPEMCFPGHRLPPDVRKAFLDCRFLERAEVETFEPLPIFERRMAEFSSAQICAIVSDDGFFLSEGLTGYCSFVPELRDATLFPSPQEALDYWARANLRSADAEKAEHVKIAQFALQLNASLHVQTMLASENAATGMMRSLIEEKALSSGLGAGARPRPKPAL
jgi:hypothetical protein